LVNRYINDRAMRHLAAQWRKVKFAEGDWHNHLRVFLEGARAAADELRAHDLVVDLDSLIDDLDARGKLAMSDFLDLSK
jgi:hypothetical protein